MASKLTQSTEPSFASFSEFGGWCAERLPEVTEGAENLEDSPRFPYKMGTKYKSHPLSRLGKDEVKGTFKVLCKWRGAE